MDNGTGANHKRVFPADFAWGVSTSAYQVEGNNFNNQWAAWEKAGRIKSRDQVGLACDWWRNAEQDFDLAKTLGVNALRLSLEWSRIEPAEGVWNGEALYRYREMLQALRSRGIRPFVTIHHFTNPLWFEAKGAFASPESVRLFERFARRVVEYLGDLCDNWSTFNEPNVYTGLGYFLGEFPPGKNALFMSSNRTRRSAGRSTMLSSNRATRNRPLIAGSPLSFTGASTTTLLRTSAPDALLFRSTASVT